jgi:hypothetical protein
MVKLLIIWGLHILNWVCSDFYYQGNYKESLKQFDKTLSIDPNDMKAMYNKGKALLHCGTFTYYISREIQGMLIMFW